MLENAGETLFLFPCFLDRLSLLSSFAPLPSLGKTVWSHSCPSQALVKATPYCLAPHLQDLPFLPPALVETSGERWQKVQVHSCPKSLWHHGYKAVCLGKEYSSVQFSHSVVSDSLQPCGLQHARVPCLSPTPRTCSNSCPSSWWYHWVGDAIKSVTPKTIHSEKCL